MFTETSQEMMAFIQRSPSCFHAVKELCALLEDAGFALLQESGIWDLHSGKGYYVTRNGSALIAFRLPQSRPAGFMIGAAHSDSPTFKLKDIAELADQNYVRLNVEKYGGAILAPWMDRPLSIAGRVAVQQGDRVLTCLVNIDRDLLLIPHMAIHMDRGMNDGRALNLEIDMLPVYGQGGVRRNAPAAGCRRRRGQSRADSCFRSVFVSAAERQCLGCRARVYFQPKAGRSAVRLGVHQSTC